MGLVHAIGCDPGTVMAIRFLTVTSAFSILAYATNPDEVLHLLSKRAHKSGLAASIAFRLVPTLLDDMKRSGDAARSRGFELDSGPFISRVRMRSAAFMPVISGSLERGLNLAESLEARGFGSSTKRTYFRKLSLPRVEVMAICCVIGTTAFAIVSSYVGLIPSYSFGRDYELALDSQALVLTTFIALGLNGPVIVALHSWRKDPSIRWREHQLQEMGDEEDELNREIQKAKREDSI